MRPLADPPGEGTPVDDARDAALRPYVTAAQDRARLAPAAVARVEARLADLDPRSARLWHAARRPAYAAVVGLAVVVAWSARPRTPSSMPAAQPQLAASTPRPPAEELRLDAGSLAVRSDDEPVVVHTPPARVEVAAHSAVRITLVDRDVRIVADVGSARIEFFDGRVELVTPADAPAAATPPDAVRAPTRASRAHVPAGVRPAPAQAATLGSTAPVDPEQASLLSAIALVRDQPQAALPALDAHMVRYPAGSTRADAERVRVAVLLRLSRRAEALATLDRMTAPSSELRAMRGELRAEAGRCEEALVDFRGVLSTSDDRFNERALVGSALCHGALGNPARMNAELDAYLARFPSGQLADKARAAKAR